MNEHQNHYFRSKRLVELAPDVLCSSLLAPLVIAEISGNHLQDEVLFRRTLEAAKSAGADLLKVQCFQPAQMSSATAVVEEKLSPWYRKNYRDLYEKTALPLPFYSIFFSFCQEHRIPGFASVFHPADVTFLERVFQPTCYKIASPEIVYHDLLRAVAILQKPVLLSLGAASRLEMVEAVEILESYRCPYILMHCSSRYPLPAREANVQTIPLLAEMFQAPIGYSDHTEGFGAAAAAVTLGASIIEKHFIYDEHSKRESADGSFSLTAEEFSRFTQTIREAADSVGTGILRREDQVEGRTYKRSVYMENGQPQILRPWNGVHPRKYLYDENGFITAQTDRSDSGEKQSRVDASFTVGI